MATAFDLQTIVGAAATAASVISFTPQAWKIVRTRDTTSISALMYALTVAGFALWLVYGALLRQWPLVITNGICCALSAFILAMKMMPPRSKDAVADVIDPNA